MSKKNPFSFIQSTRGADRIFGSASSSSTTEDNVGDDVTQLRISRVKINKWRHEDVVSFVRECGAFKPEVEEKILDILGEGEVNGDDLHVMEYADFDDFFVEGIGTKKTRLLWTLVNTCKKKSRYDPTWFLLFQKLFKLSRRFKKVKIEEVCETVELYLSKDDFYERFFEAYERFFELRELQGAQKQRQHENDIEFLKERIVELANAMDIRGGDDVSFEDCEFFFDRIKIKKSSNGEFTIPICICLSEMMDIGNFGVKTKKMCQIPVFDQPKKIKFVKKTIGKYRTTVMFGSHVLSWNPDELIIPRSSNADSLYGVYSDVPKTHELVCKDMKSLKRTLRKLSDICCEWNATRKYSAVKQNGSHCHDFADHLLFSFPLFAKGGDLPVESEPSFIDGVFDEVCKKGLKTKLSVVPFENVCELLDIEYPQTFVFGTHKALDKFCKKYLPVLRDCVEKKKCETECSEFIHVLTNYDRIFWCRCIYHDNQSTVFKPRVKRNGEGEIDCPFDHPYKVHGNIKRK